MARKPTETVQAQSPPIGVLSGGEVVALESVGRDLFFTVNGVKIARRALSVGRGIRSWITPEPSLVGDRRKDPVRKIEIRRRGKLLDWTPL
jgi:hypothetical protein